MIETNFMYIYTRVVCGIIHSACEKIDTIYHNMIYAKDGYLQVYRLQYIQATVYRSTHVDAILSNL